MYYSSRSSRSLDGKSKTWHRYTKVFFVQRSFGYVCIIKWRPEILRGTILSKLERYLTTRLPLSFFNFNHSMTSELKDFNFIFLAKWLCATIMRKKKSLIFIFLMHVFHFKAILLSIEFFCVIVCEKIKLKKIPISRILLKTLCIR